MALKPGSDAGRAFVIGDPACGTGGFLLAAHDYILQHNKLDKDQRRYLKTKALRGTDIVPGVVSLCAMNLYLHGIGSTADANDPPVDRADALAQPSGRKFDMILANPPFGKKGGYTIVGDDGKISTEKQEYERDEFWATTANKQLTLHAMHLHSVTLPQFFLDQLQHEVDEFVQGSGKFFFDGGEVAA